jgi:pseudouridine-5'-phosphate glycosidase
MQNPSIENLLLWSAEVKDAHSDGQAIVALESNVISNGLPYPQNIETVAKIDQAIRSSGAIPAVIGIDEGRILIGMTACQLEDFAAQKAKKVSSRELGSALAKKERAATTVSASLLACEAAGLPFFASPGLGGVHRRAQESFDISSDLLQLANSDVVAITAGCKSILDIGLTLEFLETHCIPCVSYQFDDFPAFYVRSSGYRTPDRIDTLDELARAVSIHKQLTKGTGFLVTVPTDEVDAIDSDLVEEAITNALSLAEKTGVTGKDVTNFVMRSVNKATNGLSDAANAAVLVSNARFAAELAVKYQASAFHNGGAVQ